MSLDKFKNLVFKVVKPGYKPSNITVPKSFSCSYYTIYATGTNTIEESFTEKTLNDVIHLNENYYGDLADQNNRRGVADRVIKSINLLEFNEDKKIEIKETEKEKYTKMEKKFWNIINKITINDKSETSIDESEEFFKRLHCYITNFHDIDEMAYVIDKLILCLEDQIKKNYESFLGYPEHIRKNVYYHIIFRGSTYYYSIYDNPDFIEYLINSDEYYTMHDAFKRYYNTWV